MAKFDAVAAKNASKWDWQNFADPLTKREFSKIADLGTADLPTKQYIRVSSGWKTGTRFRGEGKGRKDGTKFQCYVFGGRGMGVEIKDKISEFEFKNISKRPVLVKMKMNAYLVETEVI